LPIKDLYHVSNVLGVEFDSNEIFKEDAIWVITMKKINVWKKH
jgi:hypothetical protein